MISVGLIGATGYTGKYLIKFLHKHNLVEKISVYANRNAGKYLYDLFPEFEGIVENKKVLDAAELSEELDVYFFALPHGESVKYVPDLIQRNKKVIDLGGDFRLDDKELYPVWYGFEHSSPELLSQKTYGLADIHNSTGSQSNLVANPGCYPTSSLLALIPLVSEFYDSIGNVGIVSYSGTSGAGRKAKEELLLSEMDGNVKAYNVNKHRHKPEIEQELKKYGFKSNLAFTAHLLPVSRGIYTTVTVHMEQTFHEREIKEVFEKKYSDSKFVRLRNQPPELKWVVNTNFCDINVSANENTVVITSAIDNLVKGAAGQAVQNMNKLFGWDETLSLLN